MEVHPQILIFAGSLVAIVVLAGLAALMRLGGKPVLANEAEARRAANEVFDGYEPQKIALGEDGSAALLEDRTGRIMLIKRHGNQFAGRILNGAASAGLDEQRLIVDTGEKRFGSVSLSHPEAASWAEAINRLHEGHHA